MRDPRTAPDVVTLEPEQHAPEMRGRSAAPGHRIGTARLISGDRPFVPLQQGDVAICRMPQPGMSRLLTNAGALVVETGGSLSNAATLAREYGIPAVVALVGATWLIRDGQEVAVDLDFGTVRVLPSACA